ncbi:MAG: GIY-YIG nuclease family protein, partial [Steroidobacteraceae bacterium]
TPDVATRFRSHRSGKGAKFTRANPPLKILGAQEFADKSSAMQAEYALKQLDKADKLIWAQHWPYQPASHAQ